MTKVAVFGGSFSPVHRGHLAVVKGVLDAGLADRVWLMPCRRNPLKDGSTLIDDESRLRQLGCVADKLNARYGEGRVEVKDTELKMAPPSYTWDTFQKLTRDYPDCKFRLIVGADSYRDFGKWKNHDLLEKLYSPVVYPRPGYEIDEVRDGWTLLKGVEEVDISSTALRQRGIYDITLHEI